MPITSAIVKTSMMSLSKLRNAIYALCSWSDKSCLYHFCTTVFEVNLKPSHVRTTHMLHVALSSSRKAVAFRQHAQRTLSVAAMRVRNPDGSPLGIQSCHPVQTPSRPAELSAMISKYF